MLLKIIGNTVEARRQSLMRWICWVEGAGKMRLQYYIFGKYGFFNALRLNLRRLRGKK